MSDDVVDANRFPRFNFYGYEDVTARAISKKELTKLQKKAYDQEQQTQHQLEEYRRKCRRNENIISRFVQLQTKLAREKGRPIDLFDIYANFTNVEINSLNDLNVLPWLLGAQDTSIHDTGSGDNSTDDSEELCNIIQLHNNSRPQVYSKKEDRPRSNSREMEVLH